MAATYDDLATLIDKTARNVAADYPDIDWEDVRQELALFVVKNGKSIKLREQGGNPKWLLDRVAQQYAKDMRTQHMSLSPQYAYRPSDVSSILETAFMDDPMASYVPDDARDPLSGTFTVWDQQGSWKVMDADPFHFIDAVDVASDVKAVLVKLKPELKEAIFNRYVLGVIPDNNSYERKQLNKAINELTRKLNWYRGFPGNERQVMSNSSARAHLSHSYEGN
jgi:hypothetical protein